VKRPITFQSSGTDLQIWITGKKKYSSAFNFEHAGFSPKVATALLRAFVSLYGANSLESIRASWTILKRFGKFADETFGRPNRIPANGFRGFDNWLIQKEYSLRTVGATFNGTLQLLQWCQRNAPDAVHHQLELIRLPYASQARKIKPTLELIPDESLIRKILSACYQDIELTENRLHRNQLSSEDDEESPAKSIAELLYEGSEDTPSISTLLKTNVAHSVRKQLHSFGGMRSIRAEYCLNIDDIFPFYLAILTQTSGNPMSILQATNDCIVGVPLHPELERIVWAKNRATREQTADFPKSKSWSATNIVRRLLTLNQELRIHAPPAYSNSLFLCRNLQGGIAPPSWQAIHDRFKNFRSRHQLPDFELRSLRIAGAKLHHRAGRSLASAKRRLQHSKECTTQIYTPLSDLRRSHDLTILRFQGLLISESQSFASGNQPSNHTNSTTTSADTVFGFGCKDLYGGIARGSKVGEACNHFFQCASCPGAIVVVDDLENVSRLVRTHDYLVEVRKRAIKEGWGQRFDALYGPTLAILRIEILPSISDSIIEKSRHLSYPPLPHLE
jgi:hypothetical protein